jgi:hypothetical protein
MTETATDAVQEAPFDPLVRQFDGYGRSYVDFQAALCGEIDPQDPCNTELRRYVANGSSEAFCKAYRQAFDERVAEIKGASISYSFRKEGRPQSPQAVRDAFRGWRPSFGDRADADRHAKAAAEQATRKPAKFDLGVVARAAGILDANLTV